MDLWHRRWPQSLLYPERVRLRQPRFVRMRMLEGQQLP
jgi:hypothetical protein